MPGVNRTALTLLAFALALPVSMLPAPAAAAQTRTEPSPFWLAAGLGAGSVKTLAPAPAAGRDGIAASLELGYRIRPEFGVGLELGTIAPLGGCAELHCGNPATQFAPAFNRLFAFGTFRPRGSGWNLRAGLGVTSFCYERHWSANAWSWRDTVDLILDDADYDASSGGSGAWRCDAHQQALGGSVSVGYDWRLPESPLSMGLRLSAEAANFERNADNDLPGFRHRAVMLTLHLGMN